MLHDAVVFAGGLDGDAAFVDVVAARLLDVDVLAGLAGPDGHQRVPVVGRGDGHRVELLIVERLADVFDGFWPAARKRLSLFRLAFENVLIGVDQIGDLNAVDASELLQMAVAPPVQPGDAHANGVVGAEHLARRFGAGERNETGGDRRFQKLAASRA